MKIKILKDFAWYKKGQIVVRADDGQFKLLKKLELVEELEETEGEKILLGK